MQEYSSVSRHPLSRRLPEVFCWTRFGTEAGETIDQILERKELERSANGGVFLWGVGNSIAPSLPELLHRERRPELLFSPIKGAPRAGDAAPAQTAVWTRGRTVDGEVFDLPPAFRVTSRFDAGSRGSNHYALVCAVKEPLVLADCGKLVFESLTNLLTGRKLGASQVTAVVRRTPDIGDGTEYTVALRARLVAPYFLRLGAPTIVTEERRAA